MSCVLVHYMLQMAGLYCNHHPTVMTQPPTRANLHLLFGLCRAQWRSALHDVLEGQASLSPEEIDASLAESTARGEDLHAELTGLIAAVRDASSWKEREQCLGWVEDGYKRAKSITKELRSHLSLVEVSDGFGWDDVAIDQHCRAGVVASLSWYLWLSKWHAEGATTSNRGVDACAYCLCVLQSQGRSATYNNIIRTLTPAVSGLAVAVADNVAAALAPMVAQHLQPANGGYSVESQDDCVGPKGAVQRGIAAAVAGATAAVDSSSNGGSGVVLPGGDEECRLAFRLVRRWLELCKEMRDRCR